MSPVRAVASCLRQYVGFRGRARRSEFWWFLLFLYVAVIVAVFLDAALGTYGEKEDVGGLLSSITVLLLVLPSIAVQVRRLHDIDLSGWWWLLTLIPCVGVILWIVWGCIDSTSGVNRFGPSEKYPSGGPAYVPGPGGWAVEFSDFPTYAFYAAKNFLLQAGPTAPRDVYAVVVQVEQSEGPGGRPTLTVGWNTEEQVAYATSSAAIDPAEARWDALFWLREPRLVLGKAGADPQGAQLAEQWVGTEEAHEAFVRLAGDVAGTMYEDGTVVQAFGRPLPVLVQADVDEDVVSELTAAANPGGEAAAFLVWLRSR